MPITNPNVYTTLKLDRLITHFIASTKSLQWEARCHAVDESDLMWRERRRAKAPLRKC